MKGAGERNVPDHTTPRLGDVIVSKVRDGHLLFVIAGEEFAGVDDGAKPHTAETGR